MPTVPNGVVWIASYPKSGNTWMRILLSNLLAGQACAQDINDLSLHDGIASGRAVFEDETQLDSHLLLPEEIERLRPAVHEAHAAALKEPAFIKVHDAWSHLPSGMPLLGRSGRAALYLVRDPRDVAVSLTYHRSQDQDKTIRQLNCRQGRGPGTYAQFPQRLLDWSGHVRSWLDQSSVPVHLIRYEDLRADTAGVFAGALAFLGLGFASEADRGEALARAVRFADFGELQRQERAKGFLERVEGQELFFRQGTAGGWRQALSREQVRQIEDVHSETMKRLGYELFAEMKA